MSSSSTEPATREPEEEPIEATRDLDLLLEENDQGLEPLVLTTLENAKAREPRISVGQAMAQFGKANASKHLIAQEKTKAWLANRELIRRLMKSPGELKTGELNFIAGTAVDKVAKKERWDKAGDEGGKSWVEQFTAAFSKIQADTSLKLSLEVVTPGRDRSETQVLPAIDVGSVREDS